MAIRSIFLVVFCISFLAMPGLTDDSKLAPSSLKLKEIILENCSNCHVGSGDEVGRYGDFVKAGVLQSREQLSPGILYRKVESGEMPDSTYGDFLTDKAKVELLETIESWYADGKPQLEIAKGNEFVTSKEVLKLVLSDLKSMSSSQRKDTRYFSFLNLYNNPNLQSQHGIYIQALFKLINSLSWAKQIVLPRDLDGRSLVFAISLKDYNWDLATWSQILGSGSYPYSSEFQSQAKFYQAVQALSQSALPIARGDWILYNASRPPIYHEVLGLPNNLKNLETLLKVDRLRNINKLNVLRAGFNDSGVSQNNRMIERHSTPFGAYWLSYDFASNIGPQNLFKNPLGPSFNGRKFESSPFKHAGGEVIFNLPNGLQAYLLVDAQGNRIDKGPIEIVSDPSQLDRTVVNGISCMGCHDQGMIIKSDQVGPVMNSGGFSNFSAFDQFAIDRIYNQSAQLSDKIQQDKARFLKAQNAVGVEKVTPEVTRSASRNYESSLAFDQMAYELGVSPELLQEKIDKGGLDSNVDALLLFSQGLASTVKRETFESNFTLLTQSLGLPSVPIPIPANLNSTLAVGHSYTCAIVNKGVRCWGVNDLGQLEVPPLNNPTQLVAGFAHTCVFTDKGIRCWGSNEHGQLKVPSLENPRQLALGAEHSCALTNKGVRCWGSNEHGQLDIPSLNNPTYIASGVNHACALTSQGVQCWGRNHFGQVDAPPLKNPTQLVGGTRHTCAIADQRVRCWGDNSRGQLNVPPLENPVQLAAGSYHNCALTSQGVVKCWGYNINGQTKVSLLKNPTQISSMARHSCGVTSEGIQCWGQNSFGQTDVPYGL